ncbi:MAG: hypothetical protein J6K61_00260 [Clostridia bacterium]|nr:hypothetical protein [Clostridia bacterium]
MEEKKILAVKDVFCRVKQFYYGVSDKRAALYVADTGRTAEYTKALRDLRGIFTPAEQQGEAAGYLLACAEQIEEAFAERNFRLAGDLAEAGIRLCGVFDFPYFSRKRFYETVVSPLEERHGVSFFADGGKAFLAGKDKRIALRPVFTQRERHLHYSEENTDADFELAHPWLYRLFLVLGLLVFVLPIVVYAVLVNTLFGGGNGAAVLGFLGAAMLGGGLVSLLMSLIRQYMGRFLTLLLLCGGAILLTVSFMLFL